MTFRNIHHPSMKILQESGKSAKMIGRRSRESRCLMIGKAGYRTY